MPFWTSALSEPKRAHRFLLTIPNLVDEDNNFRYEQYLAKSVTKPSYDITSTEHKFLGNTFYYPGTVTWGDVSAVLINAVSPDGNKLLYDALTKSGYLLPTVQEEVFFNAGTSPGTVNKASAVDALGNIVIDELNGQGGLVGRWILNNAFITSAKFGDLSYDEDGLLNVEIGFKYDWADYTVGPAVAAVTNL